MDAPVTDHADRVSSQPMIHQPAFIDGMSRGHAFACTPARWRALLALTCAGAGLLSVILGPDNYWDLRYYHLYDPWAYLHGRYLYDIGPAQEQGFLNPTADFLLYGLVSSSLNNFPRLVAFVMGAVHGINAALLLAITRHVIRPREPAE